MTHEHEKPRVHTSLELQSLAHDLRNSLSSIYSYAQILELSLLKHDMQKEVLIAQNICESIKQMTQLIDKRVDPVGHTYDSKQD